MKEFIEIPFGAKDSELCGWEYNIPEGFVASIENGKIIVKKEESNDEKIRKWLIGYFNQYIIDGMPQVFGNGLNVKDVIAWLEKQKTSEKALQYLKENHSPSEVSDFQAAMNITVAKAYDKGYNDALEKQGEQKQDPCEHCDDVKLNCHNFPCPKKKAFDQSKSVLEVIKEENVDNANKVESKFKIGDKIVEKDFDEYSCGTIIDIKDGKYIFDDGGFVCIEEQGLWKLVEQKPAWSEDDEEKLNQLHKLIVEKAHRDYEIDTDDETLWGKYAILSNWFKSLKDRVQPRWEQEWSEDDKGNLLMIKHIVDGVWHNQHFREDIGYSTEELESLWNWLDNIWQRVKYPQNIWKPSDTQMKRFRDILDYHQFSTEGQKIMQSLYDDLRKLNEE